VNANRYVDETERPKPHDAKDVVVGRVFLSAFATFTRLPPLLAFLASWR
jgi:hypothetical protein